MKSYNPVEKILGRDKWSYGRDEDYEQEKGEDEWECPHCHIVYDREVKKCRQCNKLKR